MKPSDFPKAVGVIPVTRDCNPHVPVIMHRSGGPSAEELNVCGVCGSAIAPRDGKWTAISDQEEDRIRGK